MLVLSRQLDESIMIGDDIEITIVDVRGDKVRVGIRAPRAVQVHRKEIYQAIQQARGAAPAAAVAPLSRPVSPPSTSPRLSLRRST